MGRLQSVQVLRFLAALAVVCSHAFRAEAANIGAIGVDVFFVISGFIITRTARAKPDGFLANRATRVLPLYFLVSIPVMLFSFGVGIPVDGRRLLSTLLLWPATNSFAMPYVEVAWSLCYEAMFYVAVWLVLRGLQPAWLLVAYGVAMLAAQFTQNAVLDYLGSPLTLEFLFGVGLALWPVKSRAAGVAALALSLGAIGYFMVSGTHGIEHWIDGSGDVLIRPLAFGVPAALMVFAALQFPGVARWLAVLTFLGDASYSLYLVHLPLRFGLREIAGLSPLWVVALSVGAGAALYWYVERPAIRAARGLLKPGRAVPAAAAW